jgi:hypothetical protein
MPTAAQGIFHPSADLRMKPLGLYLALIFAYMALTPHQDEFLALPGLEDWWERI